MLETWGVGLSSPLSPQPLSPQPSRGLIFRIFANVFLPSAPGESCNVVVLAHHEWKWIINLWQKNYESAIFTISINNVWSNNVVKENKIMDLIKTTNHFVTAIWRTAIVIVHQTPVFPRLLITASVRFGRSYNAIRFRLCSPNRWFQLPGIFQHFHTIFGAILRRFPGPNSLGLQLLRTIWLTQQGHQGRLWLVAWFGWSIGCSRRAGSAQRRVMLTRVVHWILQPNISSSKQCFWQIFRLDQKSYWNLTDKQKIVYSWNFWFISHFFCFETLVFFIYFMFFIFFIPLKYKKHKNVGVGFFYSLTNYFSSDKVCLQRVLMFLVETRITENKPPPTNTTSS